MSEKQWWQRRPPTPENPVLCFVGAQALMRTSWITGYVHGIQNRFTTESSDGWPDAEPVTPIDQYQYWPGGECPVSPDTVVDVIFRAIHKKTDKAGALTWQHRDGWFIPYDIIAYRIHVED